MASRQEAKWGKEGQELICNSTIAIVGLENAGLETLKTAAMLGIGNIYLIDKSKQDDVFLDKKIDGKKRKAKQLEKIVNAIGFQSGDRERKVKVIAHEKKFIGNYAFIENLKPLPDAIFDFTNKVSSQKQAVSYGIHFANKKTIEIFLGCCDNNDLQITHYVPKAGDNVDSVINDVKITNYGSKEQDIVLSHILSGLAIEFFRKELFLKNPDKLANARDINNEKYVEYSGRFNDWLFYSLESRNKKEKTVRNIDMKKDFIEKSFLLCGCGAIGNPLAEMLAKLGAGRIDCLDYDDIAQHNIERQPLYYDRIGDLKAVVLSEKIKAIAELYGRTTESVPLVGKASNEKGEYNKDWFDKYAKNYDVIFGCFDRNIPREILNDFCKDVKFNYVDGGSETHGADIVAYQPGKTACLKCSKSVHKYAAPEKEAEKEMQERMDQNLGCLSSEITPNVNMSNRIAAALMLSEARRIISADSAMPWKGCLSYNSWGDAFGTKSEKPGCSFCQDDNSGK